MPGHERSSLGIRHTALAFNAFLCLAVGTSCVAQQGRFDLLGPSVDIHVARGDQSLPISSVPNLRAGDKLHVHADLPATQSVHLLMVVAFLRGSTNPPPDSWFTRIETWNRKVRDEGVTVTVPAEAQQALIFIAPETGGDFSTLKSAVRGRPGIFVRASQDLNEASFEQSRIERYVQALQRVPQDSPEQLLDHSRKLAATLNLKPNDECFKRAPDLQLACLRQSGTQLLLDDGHGQTLAQMLSTGPSSDLIGAVAGTPVATAGGAAVYSAYVGTVLDVIRLLTGLHTAKFQYIPAIAFPDGDALNLRLNAAPSFHDPKSVIVIALPAIQTAVPPPLQLQEAQHIACLLQPHLVLPLNGAPLVFATGFAHDLKLHLDHPAADGRTDLALEPSAYDGGLVVTNDVGRKPLATAAPEARDAVKLAVTPNSGVATSAAPRPPESASAELPISNEGTVIVTGTVHGYWGFDPFDGPSIPLQRLPGHGWTVASHGELFTGRANDLLLQADATACTREVDLAGATPQKLDWRPVEGSGGQQILVKLSLEKSSPGGVMLTVGQYGTAETTRITTTAYSDETRPQELRQHAGDAYAVLTGAGLDHVKSADIAGLELKPVPEGGTDGKLRMNASAPKGKTKNVPKAGDRGTATLILMDGRALPVPYVVDAARPSFALLNRSVQRPAQTNGLPLVLGDKDDLPGNATLTFALHAEAPAKFSRTATVEISSTDGTLETKLSLADRTLVLQDSRTVLGFLSPAKIFGPSGFGSLQVRVLAEDGTSSDWMPLGRLVRTPGIAGVSCPPKSAIEREGSESRRAEAACQMSGTDLFLIDSVAPASTFENPVSVTTGYAGGTLAVPRPADGHTLYLKLRDDPEHIANVILETERRAKGL